MTNFTQMKTEIEDKIKMLFENKRVENILPQREMDRQVERLRIQKNQLLTDTNLVRDAIEELKRKYEENEGCDVDIHREIGVCDKLLKQLGIEEEVEK